MGKTVLYGSLMILHILRKEALTSFVQAISSRIFVQQIALEDRGSVSIPRKGQMCLLPIIKTSGSSSPGFLSPFICWYHLALCINLTGSGVGLGNQCKCSTLAPACALSKRSFVSDAELLCILPASMKLGQAIACNRAKYQTLYSSKQWLVSSSGCLPDSCGSKIKITDTWVPSTEILFQEA